MNPYQSQPQNPNPAPAESVKPGTRRRFRWCTIPAVLSIFFGVLAFGAIPFGILNNINLYQDPPNRMMFWAVFAMPVASLVSGVLHVIAGLRWFRGRWLTALMCNAIAYGMMMVPIMLFESAMDTAKSLIP